MSIGYAMLMLAQAIPAAGATVPPEQTATMRPVTAEYYYRIKWGGLSEFLRLYRKNHQPILVAMQKQGFITAMRIEEPYTHLAGGERWDLRVTITFRDAQSAVGASDTYYRAEEAAIARLYPDQATFEREESQRFALVEEHWDVIVSPVSDE